MTQIEKRAFARDAVKVPKEPIAKTPFVQIAAKADDDSTSAVLCPAADVWCHELGKTEFDHIEASGMHLVRKSHGFFEKLGESKSR